MKSIYFKIDAVKEKIGKLTKDTANPFFKSRYADINQLLELAEPLLRENGLMALQPIIDGKLVTQVIALETGEMITSSLELPKLADPQKVGSAITYYRRYSLKALLNLQEEDDDANKASIKNEKQQESDNRPWLNTKQFNSALARIKDGEEGVFERIDKVFRMKKEYREQLKPA